MNNKILSKLVIKWYKKNRRVLPWRSDNLNKQIDPYLVFVSEFMLQQTTVKTVIPYFEKFIKNYPKISDLAKAKLEDILSLWSGLGYYRRANYLFQSSKIISKCFNNKIPQDYNKLIKLPGIGDYTAAAISSIAFNKKTIVIDGNIERVISRTHRISKKGSRLKLEVKNILQDNFPTCDNSLFVQGLMDIGATICKPRVVKCDLCPLKNVCSSAYFDDFLKYPRKLKKKKKFLRTGNFYCIVNKKKEILFLKNDSKGLFENMFVLPSSGWEKNDLNINLKSTYITQKIKSGIVKHKFTHFDLNANVFIYFVKTQEIKVKSYYEFIKLDNLKEREIPKLYHKIIENILGKI